MSAGTVNTGILDRLLGAFGYRKALPTPNDLYRGMGQNASFLPISFPGWEQYAQQRPGSSQDEQRARTAVQSPWVFSDLQAIANEMSTAALVVKERKAEKLEDVENHPLERLWEAPNPFMGRSYLLSFWAWSYTLSSKAYLFWSPGSDGTIKEVWPVPPFMVTPLPDTKDFIGGYAFQSGPAQKPMHIPREYVTFSRSVNIFDVRDGMSFLVAAMLGIESDLAAAAWNRNFFAEQNGVPDGLITVPRDMLDPDLARVRMEIGEFFGGTRRGVAVARAGDLDYKPFGRSQKDAEWLSGRQFDGKMVDRTLGFPEGYWSERANRANAEQARATMVAGAVWPKLVTLSEDMNAQTVQRWWGEQTRVEFDDIRPENRELWLQELEARKAFYTINELRELDGKDPLDDPRGEMFITELEKLSALPATPAAEIIDAAVAEAEAETAEADAAAASDLPPAELPEDDTPIEPLDAEEQGAAPVDTIDQADEMKADLDRWQRKAIKAQQDGRSAAVRFTPDTLPLELAQALSVALAESPDIPATKAAFREAAGWLKANLTEEETALTTRIARILQQHGIRIARAVQAGVAIDLEPLARDLEAALTTALQAGFTSAAVNAAGVAGLDAAAAAATANAWLAAYTPAAIRGMTQTTAALVQAVITQARQTPGITLEDIAARLAPAFGAARAEVIATTEYTRAAAQATQASQQYLARFGVERVMIWHTSGDDRQCPICAPRNGVRQGEGWDDMPPAHPRCRCFVTLDRAEARRA